MFDLVLDKIERPYRKRSTGATTASAFGHVVIIGTVVVLPLLFATEQLPKVPVMMAFVAPPVAPPPPPPPPPPPAPTSAKTRPAGATASSTNPNAAPIEAPTQIKPESALAPSGGQPGGVEGGIEGGVAGGIVGGLITEALPPPAPPPPPPPPPPRQPVRIGGQVIAPALLRRVEPEYPPLAVAAHVEGMVILEATVDIDGRVTDVRILRSRGFLDNAAIQAVQQWRYAPLTLNGVPTPFVLTVTLSFSLRQQRPQEVG